MRSSPRLLPLCVAALLSSAASLEAQSATLLRLSNPAAQPRLTVDSAGAVLMHGTYNVGAVQNPGAGTMLMWHPRKSAFRAGFVDGTQWNDASVGNHSTATGYGTIASGLISTAMGVGTTASGPGSTAMGNNTRASGSNSTAMGNNTTAFGSNSTAMGNNTYASGTFSTAMGTSTTANGNHATVMGSFASSNGFDGGLTYGDISTTTPLNATWDNQFSVRAAGGVRFFTNPGMTLGAQLGANATSWSTLSDRNAKAEFLAVDGEDLLGRIRRVPVSTWIYRAQPDRQVRHIGPMAQDWERAFGLTGDSLTINQGDFDGVNLAAAQALEARTREQAERIRALEAQNAALRADVARRSSAEGRERAALRKRLERLERAGAPR